MSKTLDTGRPSALFAARFDVEHDTPVLRHVFNQNIDFVWRLARTLGLTPDDADDALLQRAQEALRTQRPDEALVLLTHHGERFPRGALAEEREALRIAALCGAGELEQGLAARATFMRAYQRSPYAGRVLAACAESPESSIDSNNVQSP